ncbi:hypothetical protein KIL84_022352 [Mauremys mutica]|uniref:Transmembrane protein 82 n=1 Tax=Mauremys mutica TaxID=74926 RepID=A0A9D4ATM6_9SAUR|nr:hypothetical protein KIL84_022352 [Mauremys mutica]
MVHAVTVLFLTEEQRHNPSEQMVYQTVFVRMGGLLILLMTVGRWMDIVNIFISLVGEIWCLVRAGIMLDICRAQDFSQRFPELSSRQPQPRPEPQSRKFSSVTKSPSGGAGAES